STRSGEALERRGVRPLTVMISSPGWRPAVAAGRPGTTSTIRGAWARMTAVVYAGMYVAAAVVFTNSLEGIAELLGLCEEREWRRWIEQDLTNWHLARSVRHHLSAYGGLGAITDLRLRAAYRHRLRTDQEPWVNAGLHELLVVA